MVILPAEEFNSLIKLTKEIHSQVFGNSLKTSNCLNEYISEKDAKAEFGRKTTWFWNQRNSGRLNFKKLGGTVYYLKDDLLNLLSEK